MAEIAAKPSIFGLARSRFGDISSAENVLLTGALSGSDADCSGLPPNERTVRGELLSWLCATAENDSKLTRRGISLLGAEIIGKVDLSWARISFPISAKRCVFRDEIILRQARMLFLALSGSSVKELTATRARFEDSVLVNDGFIAERGLDLEGAMISGNLECDGSIFIGRGLTLALNADGATVKGDVRLRHGFKAARGISLIGTCISGNLDCSGGQFAGDIAKDIPALNANRSRIGMSVVLSEGFKATGGVDLQNVAIGRNLECYGGVFVGSDRICALSANRAKVEGDVCLSAGFRAEGGADLVGVIVNGGLKCNAGKFTSHGKRDALNAEGARIEGAVFLRNPFKAEGGVNFASAKIGEHLDCQGGELIGWEKSLALDASGTEVKGSVGLNDGFKAAGGVKLVSAKINGHLNCSGGEFIGKKEILALDANGAEVKGGVFLRAPFKAKGGVSLASAKIDGHLDCGGGEFIRNEKILALNANGIKVKGGVFFRAPFKAEGGADLRQAQIDGSLDCRGGEFIWNKESPALNANGAKIMGTVSLVQGFKAEGGVNLVRAKIGVNLECDKGEFIGNANASAFVANGAKIDGSVNFRSDFVAVGEVDFDNAQIDGAFRWMKAKSPLEATLTLRWAKAGILLNSEDSWPNQGRLRINGFVYDQIDDGASPNAEVQLGWLHRQPQGKDEFLSQPYEQLASILGKMGHEEAAREVMIAKNKDHASHLHWRLEWLWYGFLGKFIGYGYRPWKAFYISLVVIGIGWLLFRLGFEWNLMTPTDDKAYAVASNTALQVAKQRTSQVRDTYPKFNAFVYSMETFVPLLKLGIGEHWTPNAHRGLKLPVGWLSLIGFPGTTGSLLRYYLWFHIIIGWVLTTLWVGGLTGLVKT